MNMEICGGTVRPGLDFLSISPLLTATQNCGIVELVALHLNASQCISPHAGTSILMLLPIHKLQGCNRWEWIEGWVWLVLRLRPIFGTGLAKTRLTSHQASCCRRVNDAATSLQPGMHHSVDALHCWRRCSWHACGEFLDDCETCLCEIIIGLKDASQPYKAHDLIPLIHVRQFLLT